MLLFTMQWIRASPSLIRRSTLLVASVTALLRTLIRAARSRPASATTSSISMGSTCLSSYGSVRPATCEGLGTNFVTIFAKAVPASPIVVVGSALVLILRLSSTSSVLTSKLSKKLPSLTQWCSIPSRPLVLTFCQALRLLLVGSTTALLFTSLY